jgi:hypothetical protein
MTGIGASRPLPRVAATVCFLITERALSLGGGNRSSCPKADHGASTLHSKIGTGNLDRAQDRSESGIGATLTSMTPVCQPGWGAGLIELS